MRLLIVNQSTVRAPRKFITDWCQHIERELLRRRVLARGSGQRELTLVFLDTRAAKKMNFEFRQRAYATDVLSFDSMEPGSLGELIVCPQVLQRQSVEHGLSYREELGYMLLHGILHLLGYDHETSEADAEEMFGIQDEIFEKLLKRG